MRSSSAFLLPLLMQKAGGFCNHTFLCPNQNDSGRVWNGSRPGRGGGARGPRASERAATLDSLRCTQISAPTPVTLPWLRVREPANMWFQEFQNIQFVDEWRGRGSSSPSCLDASIGSPQGRTECKNFPHASGSAVDLELNMFHLCYRGCASITR